MNELDFYPVSKQEVVSRIVDNEAVLVLPSQGTLKVLNAVGAQIWSWIDGLRSVREIAEMLCAEYIIDQGEAELDTLEFLRNLESKGALSFSEKPLTRD